jgi:hypothetical protein
MSGLPVSRRTAIVPYASVSGAPLTAKGYSYPFCLSRGYRYFSLSGSEPRLAFRWCRGIRRALKMVFVAACLLD